MVTSVRVQFVMDLTNKHILPHICNIEITKVIYIYIYIKLSIVCLVSSRFQFGA
jgi:hypothetical protein